MPSRTKPIKKRENLWINLGCNLLLPSLLLKKSEAWFGGPPALGFCIALAFPVSYGIYDFITRRKYNFFSILGFVSILITGGIGLFQISKDWIAVKEAAIPAILGLATLFSLKMRKPLIKFLLLNEEIIDAPRVEAMLEANGKTADFNRLLERCTLWLVTSFGASAVVNFVLARHIIQSPTGTTAFNDELGSFNLLSWPVIVLPFMVVTMLILWKLIGGIHRYTGLKFEEIFAQPNS